MSWQTGKDLKERIFHLWDTKALSDCAFMAVGDDEEVKAHKVIVSAASPELEQKLQAAEGNVVTLDDVDLNILKLMFKYIYTDAFEVGSFEVAFRLGAAAKLYQLPLLADKCSKYITTTDLTVNNVLMAYELAICAENQETKKKCEEIIKSKTKEILDSDDFLKVSVCTVAAIFALDSLKIDSEVDLLRAAERYKLHLQSSNTDVGCDGDEPGSIRRALEKIRLLTLTPKQFVEHGYKILDEADAGAVLSNLVSRSGLPMPRGFSLETNPRPEKIQYTKTSNISTYSKTPNVFIAQYVLKEPLKVGSRLTLRGIPGRDPKWLVLNLRRIAETNYTKLDDIAVHFRPYFDSKLIVRNSIKEDKNWGPEELSYVGAFPFVPERLFKLEIIFEEKQTVWLVDDEYVCTFAHRTQSPIGATRVELANVVEPITLVIV